MTFEIDTAASHSLLSKNTFDRLQKCLADRGRKPLQTQQQQVSIKLADGTTTSNHVGTVQMHIAESVNCKKPILVTFFILDGPNNLLSRHTIQRLWPDVYCTLLKGTGCDQGTPRQIQDKDANKSQA